MCQRTKEKQRIFGNYEQTDESSRNKMFGNYKQTDESNSNNHFIDLLLKRNSSIPDFYKYWFQKIETEEKQLAMITIEALGMLVTSESHGRINSL